MTDIKGVKNKNNDVVSKIVKYPWFWVSFIASCGFSIFYYSIDKDVTINTFSSIICFFSSFFLSFIAANIGDALRRIAMPDAFLSTGFIDTIGKKIFWAIGPQCLGILITQVLIWIKLTDYLSKNF